MSKPLCLLISVIFAAAAPSALAWPGCEEDILTAAVHGDTLTIHHDDAAYNCCMDGIEYSVTQVGDSIHVVEIEIISMPCTCLCCYDLSVQVVDLAPGTYTLVFAWNDDAGPWQEWTQEITVLGQGAGVPSVAAATNSGCIDPAVASDFRVEPNTWGRVKSLYR